MKTFKKIMVTAFAIIGGLFVLIMVLGSCLAEETEKPLTIEDKVKNAVIESLGEETNMGKERIGGIIIEKEIAKISLNADESLTTDLTRSSMLYNSKDLFEQLDKIEGLKGYSLAWNMTLVDVKGNEFEEPVLGIWIDKPHGVKWENFNVDNFDKVASNMYTHPVLNK